MGKLLRKLRLVRKKGSIYNSFLRYLVLFALIPALVINVVYFSLSSRYINDVAIQFGQETVARAAAEVDHFLGTAVALSEVAADNQQIQTALRMDFGGDVALRYSTDLQTDAELYFATYMQPDIAGLNVLGENGGEYKSHDRAFLDQDHREQDWYRAIMESGGAHLWFEPHPGQFATVSDGGNYISFGRGVVDKATGALSGVILVDISEDVVMEMVSMRLEGIGQIFILDEEGNVILGPEGEKGRLEGLEAFVPFDGTEGTFSAPLRGLDESLSGSSQNTIVSYRQLEAVNWKVLGIIPASQLNRGGNAILVATLILTLFIIGLAIFTAVRATNRLSKPLRHLRGAMGRIEEGDWDVEIDVSSSYEEINKLAGSFNVMIGRIRELMDDIYEDQQKLRTAELKALQSQINPHFLYNTLDSILWLNRAGKQEEVQTMVEALTTFFRVGISRGKDIIPLSEELKHLESYLKIQSIRYGDKFRYEIDVEEGILGQEVPKLILQPLAENAIYHGLKIQQESGVLRVTGRGEEELIEIVVEDSGRGMEPALTEKLNRMLKGEAVEGLESYGVRNISERLRILFGEAASMRYESEEYGGTRVILHIPR